MSTEHTKLPWIAGDETRGPKRRFVAAVYGNKTTHVADVFLETPDGELEIMAGRANAAFVVRACNAHDELMAACKALVEWVEAWNPDDGTSKANKATADISAARAAIAKATGEEPK